MRRIADFWRRRLEWVPGTHRPRPFRAGVIGLLVLGGALALAYTHTSPLGGEGGHLVRAEFATANNVNQRTKVRVGGVDVGHVERVDPGSTPRTSIVVMRVGDTVVLHADAEAHLRARTLLGGNMEIELDPGSATAPKLRGGRIALSRTTTFVDWDDFNQPYTRNTRPAQQQVFRGLKDTFAAPGSIGETLHTMGPALAVVGGGSHALRGTTPGDLRRLVLATGRTLDALSRQRDALRTLVDGADRTLGATAAVRDQLGETIDLSPAALDSTRVTMDRLAITLDHLDPLVAQLRPGARALGPALRRFRPGLVQANRLLTASVPMLRVAGPTFEGLGAMSRQGTPLVRGLQPTFDRFETDLIPFLRRRDPGIGLRNYESIGPLFSGLDSAAGEFDANGYFLHFAATPGPNTVLLPCGPTSKPGEVRRCDELNAVFRRVLGAKAK